MRTHACSQDNGAIVEEAAGAALCSAREGLHWLSRPLQIRLRIRCVYTGPDCRPHEEVTRGAEGTGGGGGGDGGGGGGARWRGLSDTVVVLVEPMSEMLVLQE